MDNKVLLLNNTFSETDFIKVLKKRFKKIYTFGYNRPYNTGKLICHINGDYKDHKKILWIIKKYKIKYVFPGSNELTLFSLSKCNLKNNYLDSYKKLQILHNKKKFREFYKQIFFFNFKNNKKEVNFNKIKLPILAKPHIGSGGKNIIKFDDRKKLEFFYKNNKEKYLFEEYYKGTNHGIFTLIKNKKIIFSFFDTEQRFINPYTVSSTINYCNIPNAVKKKILKKITFFVNKLNLKDGIFHIQIKFDKKKNKFLILEPFRRIPGDKYLKFIRLSTNYPVEENILRLFLKEDEIKYKKPTLSKHILRKIIMSHKNGTFKSLKIDKKISKKIINKSIFIKKNNKIINYLNQRLGIVFFSFKNKTELLKASKEIDKNIKLKII